MNNKLALLAVGMSGAALLIALISFVPIQGQASTKTLALSADSACVNGYAYTVRDDGQLEQEWVAQPPKIMADGSKDLQRALPLRCSVTTVSKTD